MVGVLARRLTARLVTAVGLVVVVGMLVVPAPASVGRTGRASVVGAGGGFSCAVIGKRAYCWGAALELGDGTTTGRGCGGLCSTAPVEVHLSAGVIPTMIATENDHSCVVTSAGRAYCWGDNTKGQLGDGKVGGSACAGSCSSVPVAVKLSARVAAIAVGNGYSCAVTGAGGAFCWGDNGRGILGDGTTRGRACEGSCSPVPIAVHLPAGTVATEVATDNGTVCVLTRTGGAYCWGTNSHGELGDSLTADSLTPVAVHLPTGVTAAGIAVGGNHACVVTSAGGAYCWGENDWGELGNGTKTGSPVPVAVHLPAGVKATEIADGAYSSCAVSSAGGAYCWGDNADGQLGDGSRTSRTLPVAVHLPVGVKAAGIATSFAGQFDHACATTSAGGAYCWGDNGEGELGDATTKTSLAPVAVHFGTAATTTRQTKHGSAKPVSTSALAAFSNKIEADLARLAAGRLKLTTALSHAITCAISPSAAASQLAAVSSNRRRTLRSIAELAVPNAQTARIKSLLEQALTTSLASDHEYRAWLSHVTTSGGCSLTRDSHYQAAQHDDVLATLAKRRFLAMFDPLARRLHLRVWSASEI